ncbi:preprotein translocase subunit SecA [Chloroflexota bacterium]
MFKWLGSLGDSNEKEIKRLNPLVAKINSFEPDFQKLTDADLRSKTDEFKARLAEGETLDDLLPEAFAAIREAAKRTIGQRHYDVQLLGGIVLHQGKIAEMKTGEGKTLVATLPSYLNALTGQGCHLVTVNDYLARRDAHWMGPIYHALGIKVASIFPPQNPDEHQPAYLYDPGCEPADKRWPNYRAGTRREAYEADIIYGTNNEFGFDYLRDNMVLDLSQCVQGSLNYAIVDEVDNILIDEARTPLIISGAAEEAAEKYYVFARAATQLKQNEDYEIEEKTRAATLTDEGINRMEKILRAEGVLKAPSLYDPSNYGLTQYMENALKARAIFKRDRDYVVKDGQVIIVDEFTGRLMFGRRYSEGLHQSIEAKENVKIQRESVTLATITFQNYFRLYQKLAGMTGTALTEAEEFYKIYKLDVVAIPTNEPMVRNDFPDQIYKDEEIKFKAVANEIEEFYKQGRPVLLGTVSIENSELIGDILTKKGIPHQILNAKNHTREADIISQAGKPGAVTVATNMAGRGVDIILGGKPPEDGDNSKEREEWQKEHEKVVVSGGLHVIGTERHESRRIDNQLRGRSGRQGDPGSTRFYVSLEDDVVRRFGGDRVKGFMEWAGLDENTPIEHSMVSKAIENAQVRVEGHHFDIRKHLVDYDDIVNKHREVIYTERKKILSGADLKANILSMVKEEMQSIVDAHYNQNMIDPDIPALIEDASKIFPLSPQFNADNLAQMKPKQVEEMLIDYAEQLYEQKEKEEGSDNMRLLERLIMLRTIDGLWKEHLTAMDHLRQQAGLQAIRQVDPLVIYKKEGHALFDSLLANIQHDLVHLIFRASIVKKEAPAQARPQKTALPAGKKVGRNAPCPCGSGKKYKHCCGR